jgi:hypothetical protein
LIFSPRREKRLVVLSPKSPLKEKHMLRSIFFTTLLLAGCASGPMPGTITGPSGKDGAQVFVGSKTDLQAGDRVKVLHQFCSPSDGQLESLKCTKVQMGSGVVIGPISHQKTLVRLNPGSQLEKGAFVEKE